MPDAPGSYAAEHPTKHGFGEGLKSVFHEVPVWGWWVAAVGGVLVIYLHNRNQAQTTSAGAATTAADVTAGGTNVDAGDIVGLNNLMVQSEQMTTQQFQALQAQIAALQAQVTKTGQPVNSLPAGPGTPASPGHPGTYGSNYSGGVYWESQADFTQGPGTLDFLTGQFTPASPQTQAAHQATPPGVQGTLPNVVHPVQVK